MYFRKEGNEKLISSVNFTGKVYQLGNVKKLAKPEEIKKIQKYSDARKVDVMLTDRDYYVDGTGRYTAILMKPDEEFGHNAFAQKIFDFAKNPTLKDEKEPEYKSCLSALYA